MKKNHKANFEAALLALTLDRNANLSLQHQLASALRSVILDHHGHEDLRLPSTRQMATDLSVSRLTVQQVYEQLMAEGYVETRRGDGTYVARHLPPTKLTRRRLAKPRAVASQKPHLPFHPAIPDMTTFPHLQWAKHLEQAWRNPAPHLTGPADPTGLPDLRDAIADHLQAWRGLECHADQIVVTSGSREGFEIIANIIRNHGIVMTEEPSFPVMQDTFHHLGFQIEMEPVDEHGFILPRGAQFVDAVVITPSRQYPLGMTLPLSRRLELIDWAKPRGVMIIEDDYDSEFRYSGPPLPALSSLDGLQNTIYMGSFSKLLSPSLRLGYIVLPDRMVDAARSWMRIRGASASLVPQPALAAFMKSGQFAAHLRRMRRLYSARQTHLVALLQNRMSEYLDVAPDPSGMHLVAYCARKMFNWYDFDVAERAAAFDLTLRPLTRYYSAQIKMPPMGFVLGYAGFDEDTLSAAVDRFAKMMDVLTAETLAEGGEIY